LPKVNVTNKNFDFALRKFKRMVSKDNTLQEFRERMYYVKPAQKRP